MGMGDNGSANKKSKNIFAPVTNYVKDVKSETKKVVWPSFSQTVKNTVIVIVFVLIIGIVIGALDFGFGQLKYLTVKQDDVATEQSGEYITEEQMLEMLGVTGDELAQYQAMSDEEKNAFMQQKIEELNAQSSEADGGSEADSNQGSGADGQ